MKQKSAPVVLLVLFALLVMATGSASSQGFGPSQERSAEQNRNHFL